MSVIKRPGSGFASLDKEKMKAVASAGGREAHRLGRAHQWTSEQARAANVKAQASRRANKAKREAAAAAAKPKTIDVSG